MSRSSLLLPVPLCTLSPRSLCFNTFASLQLPSPAQEPTQMWRHAQLASFMTNFPPAPNTIAELFALKFAVLSGPWGGGAWVRPWAAVQSVGEGMSSLFLPWGIMACSLRGIVQHELGLLSRNRAHKQPSLPSGDLGNLWQWRAFVFFCWAWADV